MEFALIIAGDAFASFEDWREDERFDDLLEYAERLFGTKVGAYGKLCNDAE